MKINVTAICLLLLIIIGCTPSVRYTRDQSGGQPNNSLGKQQKSADDGVDGSQLGWEESGGAAERQSDWLNSALGEVDQGQPEQGQQTRRKGKGGTDQKRLERVVNSYLGVPYKHGGTTRSGFDCSGFTAAVYNEVYGIRLKRTTDAMWKEGVPVSLSAARPGDLVFFKGSSFGTIGHVGIYMGRTRFVHSASSSGVIYSNLKETYYARRFVGVRRMF